MNQPRAFAAMFGVFALGFAAGVVNPLPQTAQSSTNPAYRVQVYSSSRSELSVTRDWAIEYQFTVPPLPVSPTWDHRKGTVYEWGDVDFDGYGSAGPFKLSNYRFNQIVPQLILGSVLDTNGADYKPSWHQRSTWAIQAQYFWQSAASTPYALTGSTVGVNPGDEITTIISYKVQAGAITASIRDNSIPGSAGLSTIAIARPFPNDPSVFLSWADFFQKAVAASKTPYILATPAVDVETDYVDQQTMCGLLPLRLSKIGIPGVTPIRSAFSVQQLGAFTCSQPTVEFNFQ